MGDLSETGLIGPWLWWGRQGRGGGGEPNWGGGGMPVNQGQGGGVFPESLIPPNRGFVLRLILSSRGTLLMYIENPGSANFVRGIYSLPRPLDDYSNKG